MFHSTFWGTVEESSPDPDLHMVWRIYDTPTRNVKKDDTPPLLMQCSCLYKQRIHYNVHSVSCMIVQDDGPS